MRTAYIMSEIRATRNVPEFVRLDNLESVHINVGEVVNLPQIQSNAIMLKGYAADGKCIKSNPCIFAIGRDGCDGCSCDLTMFPHIYKWTRVDHQLWEYCE